LTGSNCGYCGKFVLFGLSHITPELVSVATDIVGADSEGHPLRMEPLSRYWLSVNGHRVFKIIEPYCNATCSLRKYEQTNETEKEMQKQTLHQG